MSEKSGTELLFCICTAVRHFSLIIFARSAFLLVFRYQETDVDCGRLANETLLLLVYCLVLNNVWFLANILKIRSMRMNKWILGQVTVDGLPVSIMMVMLYKKETVEMCISKGFVVTDIAMLVIYPALMVVQILLLFYMRKVPSPDLKDEKSATILNTDVL